MENVKELFREMPKEQEQEHYSKYSSNVQTY